MKHVGISTASVIYHTEVHFSYCLLEAGLIFKKYKSLYCFLFVSCCWEQRRDSLYYLILDSVICFQLTYMSPGFKYPFVPFTLKFESMMSTTELVII